MGKIEAPCFRPCENSDSYSYSEFSINRRQPNRPFDIKAKPWEWDFLFQVLMHLRFDILVECRRDCIFPGYSFYITGSRRTKAEGDSHSSPAIQF